MRTRKNSPNTPSEQSIFNQGFARNNSFPMGRITSLHSAHLLKPRTLVARQADGSLGVENIKTIISTVVPLAVDFTAAIASKNWFSLAALIPRLLAQAGIIAVAEEAWKEIKDTTYEESNDIHLTFTEVLDLENDETEATIEYAFGLIPRVYGHVINAMAMFADLKLFFEEIKDFFGKDAETKATKKTEAIVLKAKAGNLAKAA